MSGTRRFRLLKRYIWSIIAVAVAAVLLRLFTETLQPFLFIIFLSSVLVATVLGGMGPGLLATVLSILAATYLGEERGHLLEDPGDYPAVAMFAAVGAISSWLISRRQRAEQRLRLSEARFRVALVNSPITVTEQDRDLRYRWIYNPPIGVTSDEVIGRTESELLSLREATALEELKRRALEIQRSVRGVVEIEVDGEQFIYDTTVEPFRGPSGEIEGVMSAAMDVTPLKRIEHDLRALNETLEQRVAERTAELGRSHEKLRQSERLAAIGQMIIVLSHESRNALQRGHACLDLLVRRFSHAPEVMELISEAAKAQVDLQRIYDHLRDYAAPIRLDCGAERIQFIWREAWTELESVRRNRQVELSESFDGTDLRCEVDHFRLKQVFRNLFENCLAACSDPVRIQLDATSDEIDGRPAVCVVIRDNGPGIDTQTAERAFEPFFTTKAKGTGLGLPIVQRIVEAHGGSIQLTPSGEGGAEVVLRLPTISQS